MREALVLSQLPESAEVTPGHCLLSTSTRQLDTALDTVEAERTQTRGPTLRRPQSHRRAARFPPCGKNCEQDWPQAAMGMRRENSAGQASLIGTRVRQHELTFIGPFVCAKGFTSLNPQALYCLLYICSFI